MAKIKVSIPTFLKWAGGKQSLLQEIKQYLPEEINTYHEPFLGGGAVFFYIQQVHKPEKVFLSDLNHILVDVFRNVRDHTDELIEHLKEHKQQHDEEYYYEMRDRFNELDKTLEKSALFLYLNKTCFNGLYRENSKGEFNVPIGSYKNPNIVRAAALQKASRLLQSVQIKEQDFESSKEDMEAGDFVYLDPPYDPVSDTSNFTSYSGEDFGKDDQARLAEFCKKIDETGVLFMLSNSNTDFINELYSDFNLHKVTAKRSISANAEGRGDIFEVLVTNY
jgi:DNA adenine methylase